MAYQGYQAGAEQIGQLIFSLVNGALWIMSWGSRVSSSVGFVAWRGAPDHGEVGFQVRSWVTSPHSRSLAPSETRSASLLGLFTLPTPSYLCYLSHTFTLGKSVYSLTGFPHPVPGSERLFGESKL